MPVRNRRRYTHRGMSTAVTSIILVAAVSMMGAGLVSWSNSSFAIQRLEISNQTVSRINSINERFVIEDVWFKTLQDGTKVADITVRNTGDLAVRISHIYVNNTQVWNTGQTIPIGTSATITIHTSWSSNHAQYIWVKTSRDIGVKQVWKS